MGVKGVIPYQITLMSPFSEMMEMDQITCRSTYLKMWLALALHLMNSNPSTQVTYGLRLVFMRLLPQGHCKVISRSQQGQISSKGVKITYFCVFCPNSVHLR